MSSESSTRRMLRESPPTIGLERVPRAASLRPAPMPATTDTPQPDTTTLPASPALKATTSLPQLAAPLRPALRPLRGFTAAPGVEPAPRELVRDEIARMRFLALFAFAIAPLSALMMQFVPGSPAQRLLHGLGLLIGTTVAGWFLWRVREHTDYTPRRALVFALGIALAATSGLPYWGPYSALVMVMSFGGFILAQSRFPSLVVAVVVVAGGTHLLYGMLIALGVLVDPRPVAGIAGSVPAQVAALALIHAIMMGTVAVARVTRRKAVEHVHERDRALIELGRREALVGELREELGEVQRGDTPGRYTGVKLGGYRLGRVIGRGASSEVYEGRRDRDDAHAAVKLLHPHVLARPEQFRRFLQEARISAQFDSAHVVRTLDVPQPGESIPYIAMEYLHGETLAAVLQRSPTMPVAGVVELVRQVGRGIDVAHRAGVVHRDLKPANVFQSVDARGDIVWKVLDFGVCTLMSGRGDLTQPGMVVGTPHYMSPEQLRGQDLDERADLYALGVIAYRALTGRTPFAGDDLRRLLDDIVARTPTRPSEFASVHADVDAVFAIALAKRREARFASAEELAEALSAAARGELRDDLRALAEDPSVDQLEL